MARAAIAPTKAPVPDDAPTAISALPSDLAGEPAAIGGVPFGPGAVVGGYRIIDLLGEGGMGQVFIAQHPRLAKRVAVKVLKPEFASSPSTLKRFFQEAQAAGHIENPHIVQVFDFGDDGRGRAYIVMELLNGADLAQARQRDGPFPLARVGSIVRQIGAGLAAAHERAIVHRDLKPENIFLVRDEGADYVKLLDFGLAKLSESYYGDVAKSQLGMVVGTPDYMSPEQAAGTPVDARTDIYSLAMLVYWMIAGTLPFQAETVQQILIQRATVGAPPLPEIAASGERVPVALREAIASALDRDPNRRPQSVRELVRLIEDGLGSPGAPADRAARPLARRSRLWLAATVGLAGAAAALGWLATRSSGAVANVAAVPPPEPSQPAAAPASPEPVRSAPAPLPPLPVTAPAVLPAAAALPVGPVDSSKPSKRNPKKARPSGSGEQDQDSLLPFN